MLVLSSIRHELFTQLKDMFAPPDLMTQSIDEIKSMLKAHFTERSNLIVERYKFHSLRQAELQSSQDYLMKLRK